MSSPPSSSLKQRGPAKDKKRGSTPQPDGLMNGSANETVENLKKGAKEAVTNEWDYKLALGIITVLAFLTRFYGISHPNQVVFDEVHFGKVSLDMTTMAIVSMVGTCAGLMNRACSSPHTTSNGHTSSTYILPSESYSTHTPVGWLDMMVLFYSKTSETRISRTKCPMWHIDRCQP